MILLLQAKSVKKIMIKICKNCKFWMEYEDKEEGRYDGFCDIEECGTYFNEGCCYWKGNWREKCQK